MNKILFWPAIGLHLKIRVSIAVWSYIESFFYSQFLSLCFDIINVTHSRS